MTRAPITDRMFTGDLVVARARGALFHLAESYLTALGETAGQSSNDSWFTPAVAALAGRLGEVESLWRYCHAQAVEAAFCERFQREFALDAVSPAVLAELPMELGQQVRACQSRFLHSQRMLALDPEGLPPAEQRLALIALRRLAAETGAEADQAAQAVEIAEKERPAPVQRAEVLRQALAALPPLAWAQLDRAGVALFVSGLAEAIGCDRVEAVNLLERSRLDRLLENLKRLGVSSDVSLGSLLLIHPNLEHAEIEPQGRSV